jgi:hypothetical protein
VRTKIFCSFTQYLFFLKGVFHTLAPQAAFLDILTTYFLRHEKLIFEISNKAVLGARYGKLLKFPFTCIICEMIEESGIPNEISI